MLELRDVGYRYPGAERDALGSISLRLAAGECLGLLGSNGAGKTTLLSLVSGLRAPQRGDIHWEQPRQLGLVPQQLAFYAGLTVEENLQLFADLYGLRGNERSARLERVLEGATLEALRHRAAGRLSGGQQRRLNFAVGVLRPAPLYLLDEATVGVDAHARQRLLLAVEALRSDGAAVIYTSHYLEEVERISDRVLLLDSGAVRLDLDTRALSSATYDLLLEWTEPPPATLIEHLAALGGELTHLPAGVRLANVAPSQWPALCVLLAELPAPRLLRFGRPSLEQVYLTLTGGEL